MSIITYDETHERIAAVISARTARARRLHPEKLSISERVDTISNELREVSQALERGDYKHAMYELGDVGATLYRAFEELEQNHGERIA